MNMSYPLLSWQTFDVQFTAAKFDGDGSVQKNPVVTVRHNGVVIYENLEPPVNDYTGFRDRGTGHSG